MNRRDGLITAAVIAGAAAAAIWIVQQRHESARRTPDWKDPQQPVEGTGGEPADGLPMAPSPVASWNAVRPGSPRLGAGSVIMRSYAPTLKDDPESMVR